MPTAEFLIRNLRSYKCLKYYFLSVINYASFTAFKRSEFTYDVD